LKDARYEKPDVPVLQLDTAFSLVIARISVVFLDFTHEQSPVLDVTVTILTMKAVMTV